MNSLVYVTRCCTDLTCKVLKERTFGQSSAVLVMGMYSSRTVTLLVLIFGDVINWIPKPYIQTNILVYLALDVSTTLPVKFIRRGILTSRMW